MLRSIWLLPGSVAPRGSCLTARTNSAGGNLTAASVAPPNVSSFARMSPAKSNVTVLRQPQTPLYPAEPLSTSTAVPLELADLKDACVRGDLSRFLRIVNDSPQAIYRDQSLLHYACATAQPSMQLISEILRLRPELVHSVERNNRQYTAALSVRIVCRERRLCCCASQSRCQPPCTQQCWIRPSTFGSPQSRRQAASREAVPSSFKAPSMSTNPLPRGETAIHLCVRPMTATWNL